MERPGRIAQQSHWPSPAVELHCHLAAVPLCVTPTKPVKVKGRKRKGTKATKNIERLLSKGHVLEPEEATAFRALSARGNCLAADRPDLCYSAKESCGAFAQTNQKLIHEIKRMAKYLNSHKRLVYNYAWGDPQTVHSTPQMKSSMCASMPTSRVGAKPGEAQAVEFLCTMASA